jgi:hypothetical protein
MTLDGCANGKSVFTAEFNPSRYGRTGKIKNEPLCSLPKRYNKIQHCEQRPFDSQAHQLTFTGNIYWRPGMKEAR